MEIEKGGDFSTLWTLCWCLDRELNSSCPQVVGQQRCPYVLAFYRVQSVWDHPKGSDHIMLALSGFPENSRECCQSRLPHTCAIAAMFLRGPSGGCRHGCAHRGKKSLKNSLQSSVCLPCTASLLAMLSAWVVWDRIRPSLRQGPPFLVSSLSTCIKSSSLIYSRNSWTCRMLVPVNIWEVEVAHKDKGNRSRDFH